MGEQLYTLTGAEYSSLQGACGEGGLEYLQLLESGIPPPPGATWSAQGSISRYLPPTFPASNRNFLTHLMAEITDYRQRVAVCGVPGLEYHPPEDEVIVVISTTRKVTRKLQRKLRSTPEAPWQTYRQLVWENMTTADPPGIKSIYSTYTTETDFPTCRLVQSMEFPPDNWDGEDVRDLPDYGLYNWETVDVVKETDNTTLAYTDLAGAARASMRSRTLPVGVLRSFSARHCLQANGESNPLDGILSIVVGSSFSGVTYRTMRLHAVGHRMPFKIVYEESTYWLSDHPVHAGEHISTEEKEIVFSNSTGWEHTLSPPLSTGKGAGISNARIQFFS